jgi:hypothetical protein
MTRAVAFRKPALCCREDCGSAGLCALKPHRCVCVCEFLDLGYDARMLELGDTTYSPPSAAFANQWQRHMSEREVKLVEARVGNSMRARGCALRHEGADAPGTLTLLGLKLQNAFFRHRYRARFYGTPLWLQEMLARRLRMQSWLRQLRQRMIAIDAQHLK